MIFLMISNPKTTINNNVRAIKQIFVIDPVNHKLKTVGDARRVLGMVGYFIRYILGFPRWHTVIDRL